MYNGVGIGGKFLPPKVQIIHSASIAIEHVYTSTPLVTGSRTLHPSEIDW